MPNQRSKDKTFVGGYVRRRLQRTLTSMAKKAGMADDRFGFIVQLAMESIEGRKRKIRARGPRRLLSHRG